MVIDGVKTFSATKQRDRDRLGEQVTAWLSSQRRSDGFEVVDMRTTQSSDSEFHCLSITVLYRVGS